MVGSGQITGLEFSWTLNFKGKTRLKSTGTSPGTLDFSFWSWDFFLCSSTCCAPGLKTPSRHSGLLGPSIWTMYSPQDFSDSPEAGFHFPFFGFDFGLGLGLGLVNITVCIANYYPIWRQTRLVFDRDKPRNLEIGLWTSSMDWDWPRVTNWTPHYHSGS